MSFKDDFHSTYCHLKSGCGGAPQHLAEDDEPLLADHRRLAADLVHPRGLEVGALPLREGALEVGQVDEAGPLLSRRSPEHLDAN